MIDHEPSPRVVRVVEADVSNDIRLTECRRSIYSFEYNNLTALPKYTIKTSITFGDVAETSY